MSFHGLICHLVFVEVSIRSFLHFLNWVFLCVCVWFSFACSRNKIFIRYAFQIFSYGATLIEIWGLENNGSWVCMEVIPVSSLSVFLFSHQIFSTWGETSALFTAGCSTRNTLFSTLVTLNKYLFSK